MIYSKVGGFKDPLKQNLGPKFCRNQNKDCSILTETQINYDQMHHIRCSYCLGSIFFFPHADSQTKGLLVLLLSCPEGWRWSWRWDWRLCPLKLLRPVTVFSVLKCLQGMKTRINWLVGISLNGNKIIWKIKVIEMKTK